ncbi:hypothetical protein JCM10212_006657 [Sporobolomyces blumeae]
MSSSSTSFGASAFPSPQQLGKLNRADALAYLSRIGVPSDVIDSRPSLALLRQLQSRHMLTVPFESTTVHVKDWGALDAPIELGGGELVPLAEPGFRRVVDLRRGGYCFLLNGNFACLLRYFGFRVSECLAKVNMVRKDPDEFGVEWEALSHQVSIVDWSGSETRYLSDVGFGGGPAHPMAMIDGTEVRSIPSDDVFRLTRHESLPYASRSDLPDQAPTWVVSRRQSKSTADGDTTEIDVPQYAFALLSTSFRDVKALNWYQSTNAEAVFNRLFLASILDEKGERTTLSYHEGSVDEAGEKAARLTTTRLRSRGGDDEVLTTRFVKMTVGAVRDVLEREFGMSFPQDYRGN